MQQYDGAGNLVNIDSLSAINTQQWYYVAAVNDGSQLSFWLDSGSGYELQVHHSVDGALYQGPQLLGDLNGDTVVDAADYVWWRKNDSDNPASYDQWRADFGKKSDWWNNWTIGRAQFNGGPADWFDGTIDEVRITNSAPSPSDFLFADPVVGVGAATVPEPASALLTVLPLFGAAMVRRRRRHC